MAYIRFSDTIYTVLFLAQDESATQTRVELKKLIKSDPDHLESESLEEPDYLSVDEDDSPLDNQVCHLCATLYHLQLYQLFCTTLHINT